MIRKFSAGLAVIALVCPASTAGAQDPNYVCSITSGSAAPGGSLTIDSVVSNPTADLEGWSYGVCSGPEVTAISVDSDIDLTSAGDLLSEDGFINTAVFPGGWTQGVVVCLTGCAVIPSGSTFTMARTTYDIPGGTAPGLYPLDYCETLGVPPVAFVVVVGGASIAPTATGGSIEVLDIPDPAFTYIAPNADGGNYPSTGGLSGSTTVNFAVAETDNSGLGATFPNQTQGLSLAVSNDPAIVTPVAVTPAGALAALNGGDGPDFFTVGLFADAWSVGIVYVLTGGETVGFSAAGDDAVSVQYDGVAGALAGTVGPTSTPLTWDAGIGVPPVSLVVVVNGASFAAATTDGSITFNGTTTIAFSRGDANGDDQINIADIISILSQLFQGVPIVCSIALDVNDDGVANAADAVYLAAYIFQGGPPPPAPFGTCDTEPTQTPEDCEDAACTP